METNRTSHNQELLGYHLSPLLVILFGGGGWVTGDGAEIHLTVSMQSIRKQKITVIKMAH